MNRVKLSVNVDHVATLRQARKENFPDPVVCAIIAEHYGADGITCHIRLDRRHIQTQDLFRLKEVVKGEFNIEMCSDAEMIDLATKVKPHWVTLVPERESEITTEGGLDIIEKQKETKDAIERLKKQGISVSLFIEPEEKFVRKAKELGALAVELNTNSYAVKGTEQEFQRLKKNAFLARSLGLKTRAGHALTRQNLLKLIEIKEIEEVSIGFALIADSVVFGFGKAVEEFVNILRKQ